MATDLRQPQRIQPWRTAAGPMVFYGQLDGAMQVVSFSEARESLSGCWSRRIDDEHGLIYRLEGATLMILACRYHYR